MNVYPALLSDSLATIKHQLELAQTSPEVNTVHIDIIDGWFVDNLTITPSDLVGLDFGTLQLDFHLITDEPLDFVFEIIEHKAALPVRAIIGQIEHMSSQRDFLQDIKTHQWLAGLALDLHTPAGSIEETAWDVLDVALVYATDKIGHQGQVFDQRALKLVEEVTQQIALCDQPVEMIVDGGITAENAGQLEEAGAQSLVIGSALWQAKDFAQAVAEFT